MMNIKKRVISAFLALVMCFLCMYQFLVLAVSATTEENTFLPIVYEAAFDYGAFPSHYKSR